MAQELSPQELAERLEARWETDTRWATWMIRGLSANVSGGTSARMPDVQEPDFETIARAKTLAEAIEYAQHQPGIDLSVIAHELDTTPAALQYYKEQHLFVDADMKPSGDRSVTLAQAEEVTDPAGSRAERLALYEGLIAEDGSNWALEVDPDGTPRLFSAQHGWAEVQINPETNVVTQVVDGRRFDPTTGASSSFLPPPAPEVQKPYLGGFADPQRDGWQYEVENPEYTHRSEAYRQAQRAGVDPSRFSVQGVPDTRTPLYFEQDNWRLFAGKSPEYVASLQDQMRRAGLLRKGQAALGFWDEATASAMFQLMTEANAQGIEWDVALRAREEAWQNMSPEDLAAAAGRGPFVAPAYLAPDYDTLAQSVKQTFRQALGRDPKDYEMALLADRMNRDYRAQYSVEVAAARSEYDAANRALVYEEPQSAGSFQKVDPLASLVETFEKRYAGEIALEEDQSESLFNVRSLTSSLGGLEGMI